MAHNLALPMDGKEIDISILPATSPASNLSSENGTEPYDRMVEKRVLRKLDFQLVPVLFALFLISFIDRGNIGNAHIQGMDQDLHFKGNNYNIAVMVFVLGYVVFGIPANIIFKAVGPRSLSVMMFLWGICAVGQGLVKDFAGLVALRLLMGSFEAAFVPGCAYLLGSYYRKDEFLKRFAVFFSAATLAGAFNGFLATGFSRMGGLGGLNGWRWIFIMEGLITIAFSFGSYFLMIDLPDRPSKFFTAEEREVILARIALDGISTSNENPYQQIKEALLDWKVWVATLVYIGADENASSVIAFQPAILKGLGYTSTGAQIHSIPVYMVGLILCLTSAFLSEKLHQRFVFAFFGGCLTTIGLVIELVQPKAASIRFAGMFFLQSGPTITMCITIVWLSINIDKGYKRAVAFATVIAIGNAGAFISSNVFLTSQQPTYHLGFAVGLGMNVMSMFFLVVLYAGLRWENRRMDRRQGQIGSQEKKGGHTVTGDKSLSFRYQL